MDKQLQKEIESIAWDATVGAGNDSETVSYAVLQQRLKRQPTYEECEVFRAAWTRGVRDVIESFRELTNAWMDEP